MPHKRYVLPDMERFSGEYVEDERQTYRKAVCPQDIPIGYLEPDGRPAERFLAHSTPWRWISFLGSIKDTLRQALHLIRQKDSTSAIFREVFPVAPHKSMSLT
jgi:hypothetical protein